MTAYSQGDVVLIPFPFTDFSTTKQRPAVVISSASFNASHDDVIVMAITSQVPEIINEEDYAIAEQEIANAGLLKASLIKPYKITLVAKILVRKKLGQLPKPAINTIKSKFLKIIG